MCGLICEPSPNRNRPSAVDLEIVGGVCQMKWAARPRDGHVGHQFEVGAFGGDHQREEHVVLSFKGEGAVSNPAPQAHVRGSVPCLVNPRAADGFS